MIFYRLIYSKRIQFEHCLPWKYVQFRDTRRVFVDIITLFQISKTCKIRFSMILFCLFLRKIYSLWHNSFINSINYKSKTPLLISAVNIKKTSWLTKDSLTKLFQAKEIFLKYLYAVFIAVFNNYDSIEGRIITSN